MQSCSAADQLPASRWTLRSMPAVFRSPASPGTTRLARARFPRSRPLRVLASRRRDLQTRFWSRLIACPHVASRNLDPGCASPRKLLTRSPSVMRRKTRFASGCCPLAMICRTACYRHSHSLTTAVRMKTGVGGLSRPPSSNAIYVHLQAAAGQ